MALNADQNCQTRFLNIEDLGNVNAAHKHIILRMHTHTKHYMRAE